jgi:hypothetical protein
MGVSGAGSCCVYVQQFTPNRMIVKEKATILGEKSDRCIGAIRLSTGMYAMP